MARVGNIVCESGKCRKVKTKKTAKAPVPKKHLSKPRQKLKHSLDIEGAANMLRKRYKDM